MPATHFPDLQMAVEERMMDGAPLDGVEAFIEDQPLPADLKSALWLIAWSLQADPTVPRRARPRAAAVEAPYD